MIKENNKVIPDNIVIFIKYEKQPRIVWVDAENWGAPTSNNSSGSRKPILRQAAE